MEPAPALEAVDAGAAWIFHQCGASLVRQGDREADRLLGLARRECIGPSERERLYAKGERKRRMPTVVMAERWTGPEGQTLNVFREDGPYLLPPRERPERL
jgi:hypothetical protein